MGYKTSFHLCRRFSSNNNDEEQEIKKEDITRPYLSFLKFPEMETVAKNNENIKLQVQNNNLSKRLERRGRGGIKFTEKAKITSSHITSKSLALIRSICFCTHRFVIFTYQLVILIPGYIFYFPYFYYICLVRFVIFVMPSVQACCFCSYLVIFVSSNVSFYTVLPLSQAFSDRFVIQDCVSSFLNKPLILVAYFCYFCHCLYFWT